MMFAGTSPNRTGLRIQNLIQHLLRPRILGPFVVRYPFDSIAIKHLQPYLATPPRGRGTKRNSVDISYSKR